MLQERVRVPRQCSVISPVIHTLQPYLILDLLTISRRHAKSSHKLNYCRHCCDFYDSKSRFCPGCQLFCMSPTCFQANLDSEAGHALSQRHSRGQHCPKVWGSTSGVSDEQVLDYLRRLGKPIRLFSPSARLSDIKLKTSTAKPRVKISTSQVRESLLISRRTLSLDLGQSKAI